ncbi:MAG: hypothetical protein ACKVP7_00560 [Hyphomicrobiaceae bacterium]
MLEDSLRAAADALSAAAGSFLADPLKAPGEKEQSHSLFAEVSDVATAIRGASDATTLHRIERDRLRPVAQSIRRYARRHNLQVVRCPWSAIEPDPNAIAIIAGAGAAELETAAVHARLRLINPRVGQPADSELWRCVAGAETLLVDLRTVERATVWPRACYAIGIALTIGRQIVIATDGVLDLPFDLSLISVEYDTVPDHGQLAAAIVNAVAMPCGGGRDRTAIMSAATYALDVAAAHDARTRHTAARIRERMTAHQVDPISLRRAIGGHLSMSDSEYRIEHSSFRPSYPVTGEPRCFHILPFKLEPWITETVRAACSPDMIYVRGDTEPDLQILERIWTGIGKSSLVIVDLTSLDQDSELGVNAFLNPNVCLEYAVAQTLGRPLLICHHRATWERRRLFPEISRQSVEVYANAGELREIVEKRVRTI